MSKDKKKIVSEPYICQYEEYEHPPEYDFDNTAWYAHVKRTQSLYEQKARLKRHQANTQLAINWFMVLALIAVFIHLSILSIKFIAFITT